MQTYHHLVRKAQAAEGRQREEAFGDLVMQFQPMARAWAYHALGDPQQAQDVAQEAFLTAYQKLDQLRDPAAFPAWLKRIVLTYCHRATRRRSPDFLPLDDETLPADPAASADERDLKEQVTQAVRALPDHERVVTELFYISGCSQQEIAEQLALPLTTVKKRLQYAREHLREAMPTMSLLAQGSALAALDGDLVRLLALVYPELLVAA